MLTIPGGKLVPIWCPDMMHQHAPTPVSLNVSVMWRTSGVAFLSSSRVVAPTQNIMNYHVLVHVGASVWGTKGAPMRPPIPANGAKDNEFPLFRDSRR